MTSTWFNLTSGGTLVARSNNDRALVAIVETLRPGVAWQRREDGALIADGYVIAREAAAEKRALR